MNAPAPCTARVQSAMVAKVLQTSLKSKTAAVSPATPAVFLRQSSRDRAPGVPGRELMPSASFRAVSGIIFVLSRQVRVLFENNGGKRHRGAAHAARPSRDVARLWRARPAQLPRPPSVPTRPAPSRQNMSTPGIVEFSENTFAATPVALHRRFGHVRTRVGVVMFKRGLAPSNRVSLNEWGRKAANQWFSPYEPCLFRMSVGHAVADTYARHHMFNCLIPTVAGDAMFVRPACSPCLFPCGL